MAFPNKKPDLTMILGVGKRPPREEAPPPFGGSKATPPNPADGVDAAEQESDLTPEMLDYSGPEEHCEACKHFTAPSTCDRWADPVDATGHCEGFQGSSDQGGTGDLGADGETAA
jgi:hypothetical protein